MHFTDLFKQIIFSVWSHKARSSLALFGIMWGTLTVLLLLSLGNGFYAKSIKNLAFLNNGSIVAWPGTTSKPYAGMPEGQKVHFQINDFLKIMQNIPGIQNFTPMYHEKADFRYQNNSTSGDMIGVGESYAETGQLVLTEGSRFINALDVKANHRVVFIDANLKKILFPKEEPFGKTIYVNDIPFVVIGTENPDEQSGIRFGGGSMGYVPYTTFLALMGVQADISNILVTPTSLTESPRIKHNLKNMLARNLHYDPTDEDAFNMPDLEEQQVFITWFFRVIEFFLGFCGVLTLSVGGLGIANMMFLIVTERTREIGLRKALGAEEKHILWQFLLETLFLVGLGGLLGSLIAGIIFISLPYLHLPEWLGVPHVSLGTACMTTLILLVVGLLSGFFPARRAAKMEPVKALGF